MDNLTQILEAILFASGTARKKVDILSLLPMISKTDFDTSINELKQKYSGESGVLLLDFNGKLQFSTNPTYGDIVAEVLTPLKEKELSKTLLEVLAIVAYKQPVTRLELEKIKRTSADYAISFLLKAKLIEVVGRKDAVGRPVLYGTTDEFLKKFQLENIDALPDYQAVMDRLEELGVFNKAQVELYREIDVDETLWNNGEDEEEKRRAERLEEIDKKFNDTAIIDNMFEEEEEIPDFLQGEDFVVVE